MTRPSVGTAFRLRRLSAQLVDRLPQRQVPRCSTDGHPASRGVLLPVAPRAQLLDKSEMGGLPAEFIAGPGRIGALVEEQHLGEVLTQTRASLALDPGTAPGAPTATSPRLRARLTAARARTSTDSSGGLPSTVLLHVREDPWWGLLRKGLTAVRSTCPGRAGTVGSLAVRAKPTAKCTVLAK